MPVFMGQSGQLTLVDPLSDENDKRRLRVFLTDQGKTVLEEYAPVLAALKAEVFKGICPEELKAMHQTHLHILSNLGVDL